MSARGKSGTAPLPATAAWLMLLLLLALPPRASAILTITTLASFPEGGPARNPPPVAGGDFALVAAGRKIGQVITFPNSVALSHLVFQLDAGTVSADRAGTVQVTLYQALGQRPHTGPSFSNFTTFTDSGLLPAGLTDGAVLKLALQTPVTLPRGQYVVVLGSTDASLNFKLSTDDAYTGGGLLLGNSATGNVWAPANPPGLDLGFAAFGTSAAGPPPPAHRPPNILFILADDMSWTDIQTGTNFGPNVINGTNYGNDYAQTPNIARLAREGLSFTFAHAQPNCLPSRAALLSGQYPPRSGNGVYGNALNSYGTLTAPANAVSVPASTVTSAESLRAAGYLTAHFGKWHIGTTDATLPLNQGFDCNFGGTSSGDVGGSYFADPSGVFNNSIGPALDPWGAPYTTAYIDAVLRPMATNHAAVPNNPGPLNGTVKHLGDAMGDAAKAWLQDYVNGPFTDRPFYLQYFTNEPHIPIQPRPDLTTKYNALPPGKYHNSAINAALVEGLDQQVGRLLELLDDPHGDGSGRNALTSNTVVIFMSDNGGWIPHTQNWPLRAAKATFYGGGLRVPLIVRQPGKIPAGKMSDTMVHNVDFYPTFLELAGAAPPPNQGLDGTSFASHLHDPAGVPRPRAPIYYHFPGYYDYRARPCSAVIKEVNGKRYKLIYNYDFTYTQPGPAPQPSDNVPGATFLVPLTQPWELYNLTDDLSELNNLMERRTYSGWLIDGAAAKSLAADLAAWLRQSSRDWEAKQMTDSASGLPLAFPPATIADVPPPQGRTFRITNATPDVPLQQITLTWNSETGFRYALQASPDLVHWSTLVSNLAPAGSSTTLTTADPAIGQGPRYYRVQVNRSQ